MDPKHLSSFLEKYKKLGAPKRHIKEQLNIFLKTEGAISDVTIRDGVLYIVASGAVKQELFIKKKKLLSFLKERGAPFPIIDIR